MLLAAFSTTATTAGGPVIALAKGGNATLGSHTIVTDGEELGNIIAFGDDGNDLETPAASIQFEVDGTPGANDMPGRIIFNTTADGATALTERLRIDATGLVTFANGFSVGSDAAGDTLYHNGTNYIRLVKGDDDQVLTLASGVPTWAAVPAGAASSLAATSASANLPIVSITNTHADATAGFIKFVKDPASGQGADNDVLGTITWYGTDAGNNAPEELARIQTTVVEADHGSEAAAMKFYVAENDATVTAGLQLLGQATADGEIDVTIAAGAASTTTIAGTLTMGSTSAMTNAGLVSVANQSGITGLGTITSGTWQSTDVGVAYGGTGASTATAGFDALSPMTAEGDVLYGEESTDFAPVLNLLVGPFALPTPTLVPCACSAISILLLNCLPVPIWRSLPLPLNPPTLFWCAPAAVEPARSRFLPPLPTLTFPKLPSFVHLWLTGFQTSPALGGEESLLSKKVSSAITPFATGILLK